jgi:acyl-coenzyme A synthetase/AMP-(fatty) acid ligase
MLQRRLGAAPRRALHSVFAAAAAHPRRVALAWRRPDDALHGPLRNVRYDELLSMAADAAARVRQTTAAAAARKGEPPRVAVFGPPSPDLVAAMWGVWRLGARVRVRAHSLSSCLTHPAANAALWCRSLTQPRPPRSLTH